MPAKTHNHRKMAGFKWLISRGEKHPTQKGYRSSTYQTTHEVVRPDGTPVRYELVADYSDTRPCGSRWHGNLYRKVGPAKFSAPFAPIIAYSFKDCAGALVMAMTTNAQVHIAEQEPEETPVKLHSKPSDQPGRVYLEVTLNTGDSKVEARHVKELVEEALGERGTVEAARYRPGRPQEEDI